MKTTETESKPEAPAVGRPEGLAETHCSPAVDAYRAFHNARLEKLNAFVAKRMKRMIRQGFNNSGPVQWECIYKGLKELPEFSEQAVWEAAWNACLENVWNQATLTRPAANTQNVE